MISQPGDDELRAKVATAARKVSAALLAERNDRGIWIGELSSSALSTATAICALSIAGNTHDVALIENALDWLARNINPDGGWGDTDRSVSNLSTTALCWSAFGIVTGADDRHRETVSAAAAFLKKHAGNLAPESLVPAIENRYGHDRTFSVPIIMTCALAGRLGENGWHHVKQLPLELAALPHQFFGALRLPVVSYALPALIAIGLARHAHLPSSNPIARLNRDFVTSRVLKKLQRIQPANDGFLEATPLTSFVAMALASAGLSNHEVTTRCLEFLRGSVRRDGSWPIDTNLSTWLTTLSVSALPAEAYADSARKNICDWLMKQQHCKEHSYTHAAPGGWAWTDLPGGVPDADDTAGALIALRKFDVPHEFTDAASLGVQWLLDLQNRDGGVPTFCRGWGLLPFDRSAPDLTAHAVRAWLAWHDDVSPEVQSRINRAMTRAISYLSHVQLADGSWLPLWFGNQHAPEETNPVYGTSRVMLALCEIDSAQSLLSRATEWLIAAQNEDGGWGGSHGSPSSVEETALAVESLASALGKVEFASLERAMISGTKWLTEKLESGERTIPSPIGLYFAKLWYYEKLYPLIFTAAALNRVASVLPCSGAL